MRAQRSIRKSGELPHACEAESTGKIGSMLERLLVATPDRLRGSVSIR